jgi:hypothetical protein
VWVCVCIETVEILRHKKTLVWIQTHIWSGNCLIEWKGRCVFILFFKLFLKEWDRHRSERKKQACRFLMRICLAVWYASLLVCVCLYEFVCQIWIGECRMTFLQTHTHTHTLIMISLHSIVYTHTVFLLFFKLALYRLQWNL